MQKLSETAAFVRLMQVSRQQLLRAQGRYDACNGEPDDGLFQCEIAAENAVQAPEGTEDAGNDEKGREECALAHGRASGGLDLEPENAIETARLSLESSDRQPLELELAGIGRKFAPLRDRASRDAEQFGEARRVLRVVDGI